MRQALLDASAVQFTHRQFSRYWLKDEKLMYEYLFTKLCYRAAQYIVSASTSQFARVLQRHCRTQCQVRQINSCVMQQLFSAGYKTIRCRLNILIWLEMVDYMRVTAPHVHLQGLLREVFLIKKRRNTPPPALSPLVQGPRMMKID